MIVYYFDINARQAIQAPGTLAPAPAQTWTYGDNYNLAIYLTSNGTLQAISATDALSLWLYQPPATPPAQQLCIVGTMTIATDPAGAKYYQVNVNLKTTQLAALTQTPYKPAQCNFRFIFSPADGERFSSSADLLTTVNPDPSEAASGATPVPPSYPTDPSTFERIANKGVANGYPSLDATGKVPVAELPTSTAGGDMLKSVYDKDNNGIVDTCDTLQVSRVVGLGSAATQNVPTTGNASTTQVVLGSDSRLTDTRAPTPHATTHNGGTDPIPLMTPTAQGLCPPVDGTTIQIVSGKLTATTTGNGDMLKSVFATNNPLNTTGIVDNALSVQTHQIPATGNASGAQLVIATDSRLSDARTPTIHEATHMPGGSDPLGLATTAGAGLCPPPDGTTILISGGKLVAATGGIGQHGCRLRNSAPITYPPTNNLMTWDTVMWGTDSFAPASGGTAITIPSGMAGLYEVGAWILTQTAASGTYRRIALRYNATSNNYLVSNCIFIPGTGTVVMGQGTEQNISTIFRFNAGDTIDVFVQTDATGLNISSAYSNGSAFWCIRIS